MNIRSKGRNMQGFSGANRRKHYRVELSTEHQMEIILLVAAGEVRGRLVDVSVGGLAATFARGSDPNLQPGQRVAARITLVWLDRILNVGLVEIKHRAEESHSIRYGMEFVNPGVLLGQLDASLWPYLNRRAAFRVQPDPASPVSVTLQWGETVLEGRLYDISTGGIAVTLRPDEDLPTETEVRLSFVIPGHEVPLQFKGTVRYGLSGDERRRYGIEFVEETDQVSEAQQQAIAWYVMRRQQEILRQRSR